MGKFRKGELRSKHPSINPLNRRTNDWREGEPDIIVRGLGGGSAKERTEGSAGETMYKGESGGTTRVGYSTRTLGERRKNPYKKRVGLVQAIKNYFGL